MNKHTPGPWSIVEIESPELGHRLEIASELGYVAEIDLVPGGRAGRAKHEANALLIAASPDLLEACRRAIASDQTHDGVREALLAAIAKAEGRA